MTTCFSIIFVKVCEKSERFRLYMDSLKTISQNIVFELPQTTYCDIWDVEAAGSIPVTRTKNEPKCRNLGSFLTFDNKLREEKWRLKIF